MAEHTVRLADLQLGTAAISVTGVRLDSRQVAAGDLYAALPGQHTHGARFAADAVARVRWRCSPTGPGATWCRPASR